MTYTNQYHSLLRSLHKLYSKVGFLHLQKRLQRHRRGPQGIKQYDISELLGKHVDRLTSCASSDTCCDLSQHQQKNRTGKSSARKFTLASSAVVDMRNSFRKDRHLSGRAASLGDTLKKSAWTHMHAALRLAKQGQLNSARIHANIANQAVKEVAHFMPEVEYEEFSTEIRNTLNKVK